MPDAEAVRMSNVKSGAQFTQPPRTRRPHASRCYQEQAARFGLSGQHRSMGCSLRTIRRTYKLLNLPLPGSACIICDAREWALPHCGQRDPRKSNVPSDFCGTVLCDAWTLALTATGSVDSSRHFRLSTSFALINTVLRPCMPRNCQRLAPAYELLISGVGVLGSALRRTLWHRDA